MIAVIATVQAREGREQELKRVLEDLVVETRRETGCVQYDLHVSQEDPAAFAFYERWSDAAALDAHLVTPHIGNAMRLAEELATAEPVITTYSIAE